MGTILSFHMRESFHYVHLWLPLLFVMEEAVGTVVVFGRRSSTCYLVICTKSDNNFAATLIILDIMMDRNRFKYALLIALTRHSCTL
jgi:hypothetical protein